MLRNIRRLLVAAISLTLLVATATAASAYESLTLERAGAIRQISEGKVAFVGSIINVACNLTLSGELNAGPYRGELPILVGLVTSLTWRECTGGEIFSILGLPWQIEIEKVLEPGRATRIGAIRPEAVTGLLVALVESGGEPVGWDLQLRAIICLFGGRGEKPSASLPATRTGSREGRFSYSLGALTILEEVIFRKDEGPEACPGEGFIRGRFTPAEPGQTAIFQ